MNLSELAVQMAMHTTAPATDGDEFRTEVARNHDYPITADHLP